MQEFHCCLTFRASEWLRPILFQNSIFRHCKIQNQSALLAILMNGRDLMIDYIARRCVLYLLSIDLNRTAFTLCQAGNRLDQFFLPISINASDPNDFSLSHLQGKGRLPLANHAHP